MTDIFLAIVIEKGGKEYNNPLLAVGVCVASFAKGVIEKKVWYCKPEVGTSFELKCIYEFWCKHPEVLKRVDEEGKPLKEQMISFQQFLTKLDINYPPESYNIVLLSDNPLYALGQLDYYFTKYTDDIPVRYSRKGKYRDVIDPSERLEVFDFGDIKNDIVDKTVGYDHFPENDAHNIYIQHLLVTGATNVLRRNNLTLSELKERFLKLSSATTDVIEIILQEAALSGCFIFNSRK